MTHIHIKGGRPLHGDMKVHGAKNAALPLIASTLLTEDEVHLTGVPLLSDITDMAHILRHLGADLPTCAPNHLKVRATNIHTQQAPYDLVGRLRASFLVLGPLLTRFGYALVPMPGGDPIGARPVDIHLKGLEQMGARIRLVAGNVEASCKRLYGAPIVMSFPSVNATQQLMLAATLAKGDTHIRGAAREPEVVDLAQCLRSMGAHIEGEGTHHITIGGRERLNGTTYGVMPDRIEAGTYIMMGLMTGGHIRIHGIDPYVTMPSTWALLQRLGEDVVCYRENSIHVVAPFKERWPAMDVTTQPFPGFATDLQPQFMSLMVRCLGHAHITETMFDNRFMHVPELVRMGACIDIQGQKAHIQGVDQLNGGSVKATDIRASVCLIAAGLVARGETRLYGVEHVDRGYENLEDTLRTCGADIERVNSVG